MKKILFCVLFSQLTYSQVGIGNSSPKGALDLRGTPTNNMGLVLSQTSDITQMKTPDGSPVLQGTLVWDDQKKCVRFKTVSTWSECMVTTSEIPNISEIGTLLDVAANGRAPVRVKRDANGYPMYTLSQGGLAYINNTNSNAYGAGKNNKSYPPLTKQVGENLNPVFVSNTKFISHSIGGYDSSSNNYLYSVGVTNDGGVYVSGSNKYGQLGTGNEDPVLVYTNVTNLISGLSPGEKVIKVVAGSTNVILLTNQGNIFAAGFSYNGGNANGVAVNQYQNIFKKAIFRTDDETSANDKFITDIFVSSTTAECFTAVSSTNKVFAWGRILGSGLLSAKPNTPSEDNGNFGTSGSNTFSAQYTSSLTNVTKTFEGVSANILPNSKVERFVVGSGASYLLLKDGRLFGVGYAVNVDLAYTNSSNIYYTSPRLINALFYPQANYQNNSTIAEAHKIIDINYTTYLQDRGGLFGLFGYKYASNFLSGGSYYYNDARAGIMAITKNDLFQKGRNFDSNEANGARLGGGNNSDILQWSKFDKSSSEFSEMEFVSVQLDIFKSIIGVKRPTETLADGVRLFGSGWGEDGDAGSTVKDIKASIIFKPVTY